MVRWLGIKRHDLLRPCAAEKNRFLANDFSQNPTLTPQQMQATPARYRTSLSPRGLTPCAVWRATAAKQADRGA